MGIVWGNADRACAETLGRLPTLTELKLVLDEIRRAIPPLPVFHPFVVKGTGRSVWSSTRTLWTPNTSSDSPDLWTVDIIYFRLGYHGS